jgi:hypothetical protein
VGSLIFLTNIRLNIVFATSYESRYTAAPQQAHMDVAKRILQYIKGTTDLRLLLPRKDVGQKVGYVDVDQVRDLDKRRSTIGLLFNLGCNSIM